MLDRSSTDTPAAPENAVAMAQREIEIKLLSGYGSIQDAASHPLLAEALAGRRARNLNTTYYDDERGSLQEAGIALRVRRVYGRYIMTVKFPATMANGIFARDEIEVRLPSGTPDIDRFGADVAGRIRERCGNNPLGPVFATQFKRRAGMIESGGAKIELAFDTGKVEANGQSEALDEIELELKQGSEIILYELAAGLIRDKALRLGALSKAQRGSLLARGVPPAFCKASVPRLPHDIVLDDFIAEVINQCLGQFVANWPALEEGNSPEGVHQARVSLRRLRAMLGLFAKVIPSPEFRIFRAEAKAIASALGPARDWDVFIDMVNTGPMGLYAHDESFAALLARAAAHREHAYELARKTLGDPMTSCFVLNLRIFAVRRGWRNVLSGAQLPVLGEDARRFCTRTMSRLHKKALQRGKHLTALGVEERHDLRIELKKLRYAAEFSGPFFGGTKNQKRYAKAASGLQDVLGAFNDEAVAHGLVDRLEADVRDTKNAASLSRAAGIVLGWCGRGKIDADFRLERTWDRFMETKRFWD